MTEITRILSAIREGHAQASEELLPLVYNELRALAVSKMARETPGQTLQATALVHEAYFKLVDLHSARFRDRAHFLAMASRVMRRLLIDRATYSGALSG